ncbi:predicted protein [Postia placenta Mad-698-R]|nr:predicted protein [Postia placenta Mad-698-R]
MYRIGRLAQTICLKTKEFHKFTFTAYSITVHQESAIKPPIALTNGLRVLIRNYPLKSLLYKSQVSDGQSAHCLILRVLDYMPPAITDMTTLALARRLTSVHPLRPTEVIGKQAIPPSAPLQWTGQVINISRRQ